MDGILLVDKPEGMTSADVVRVVKRCLRVKTGHLGTLDPFASGVLPVCVGEGTKIAQFLNTADKEYVGRIRLGSATDTGDPTGTVTTTAPLPALRAADLVAVARCFTGERLQTPPMYSAIKRHGTPLYALARQGIEVERAPRHVHIHALRLAGVGDGRVEFSVTCSKGTYVRVLAAEIAVALGTVGHLEVLRRTRFGPFRLEDAIALDALDHAAAHVIGLREALLGLREIRIDAAGVQQARHGQVQVLRSLPPGTPCEAVKLIGPNGELASVVVVDHGGGWRFARVFGDERAAAR